MDPETALHLIGQTLKDHLNLLGEKQPSAAACMAPQLQVAINVLKDAAGIKAPEVEPASEGSDG